MDEETKDLLVDNQIVNGSEFNEDYLGVKIDLSYKQPIGEKLKFEIGYQSQLQDNPNTLIFDANIIDESLEGSITNESNLKRDIHAFFFEFENDFNDKFSIADITAWRVIYWFYCGKLDQINNKFLDKFPLIQNFFKQMNTYKPFIELKEYKDIIS